MKLFILFILIQCLLANVIKKSLKLTCSCERSSLCRSNGIFKEEIDAKTLISIESCDGFEILNVEELQISWARGGITKSFQEYIKLKVLKISNSCLENLSTNFFKDLSFLEKLVLNGNEIKNFEDFPEMLDLKKLFLAKNEIEMINKQTFRNLKTLKVLNLEDNKIFHINSEAFSENQNLEELNLNRNDLSFLEPSIFHRNVKLKEIALNYNKIKTLHLETFTSNVDLEILRLHQNKLQTLDKKLFINNKILRWIEMGDNELIFLNSKTFATLNNLEFVDLADNECIEGSFPVKMNFEHLLKLVDRNCHFLSAYYFEFI